MNDKLIWEVKEVNIDDLKDWSKNPRKLSKENYQRLVNSIKKNGFHDVLKIDIDGTIISGHQRKKALKELGIERIKVIYPNRKLTDDEMEVISLESNRHDGIFDFDILGNMFEIENLLESGFQEFELGVKNINTTLNQKEVNFLAIEDSLKNECPKCHFKY